MIYIYIKKYERTAFVGWDVGLAVVGGGVGLAVVGRGVGLAVVGWAVVGGAFRSVQSLDGLSYVHVPAASQPFLSPLKPLHAWRWRSSWWWLLRGKLSRSRRRSAGQPPQSATDEHWIAGLCEQYPIPGAMGDKVVGWLVVGWAVVGAFVVGLSVVGVFVGYWLERRREYVECRWDFVPTIHTYNE